MNERKGNGFSDNSSDTMGRSLLWYSGVISYLGRIQRELKSYPETLAYREKRNIMQADF